MSELFVRISKFNGEIFNKDQSENCFLNEDYFVSYDFGSKFIEDKICVNNDNFIIVLDGVIFNCAELKQKYSSDWDVTIEKMYLEYGDTFFNEFRGSFCGVLYNKKTKKWIIYSDHIGSKHVYYAVFNDYVVISSNIAKLYDFFKINNIQYSSSNTIN